MAVPGLPEALPELAPEAVVLEALGTASMAALFALGRQTAERLLVS